MLAYIDERSDDEVNYPSICKHVKYIQVALEVFNMVSAITSLPCALRILNPVMKIRSNPCSISGYSPQSYG
ncbi:unnamed protein product [Larinioides sclopetarius]|uniref:Uncharacterized protein n=1 Tax=Larinioides sclopetarius TaxID=280406 RepID=A0AAV1YSF0_9ARAC